MYAFLFGALFLSAVWIAARLLDPAGSGRGQLPSTGAVGTLTRGYDPAARLRPEEARDDLPVIDNYDPDRQILTVPVFAPTRAQPAMGHWLLDTLKVRERGGDTQVEVQGRTILVVERVTDLAVGVRPQPDDSLHLDMYGTPVTAESLDVILVVQPPASVAEHPRWM